MVLYSEEVSLNIRPKIMSDLLGDICNVSDKIDKLDDIVKRLEDEMMKIDAFKRQLPLTVLLINDAIVALKEEVMQCKKTNVKPLLEEFIPLKKSCYEVEDKVELDKESEDKKNWMSSVQLWNHSDNHDSEVNSKQKKVVEISKESVQENVAATANLYTPCRSGIEGRAFMPFKGYSAVPLLAKKEEVLEESPVPRLSLFIPGTSSPSEGLVSSVLSLKASAGRALSFSNPNAQSILRTSLEPSKQQTGRKRRRCWSQELHIRFVSALQQLGGSQVATPKQIRDLMQVDGLTNDEVKSHLQKYRLHTRKVPAGTTPTPSNRSALALGGRWTCQDQYSESAKQSQLQSGSPQGPLQLTETTEGTSTGRTDSMEDDEDDKSESFCCKTWNPTPIKTDV